MSDLNIKKIKLDWEENEKKFIIFNFFNLEKNLKNWFIKIYKPFLNKKENLVFFINEEYWSKLKKIIDFLDEESKKKYL